MYKGLRLLNWELETHLTPYTFYFLGEASERRPWITEHDDAGRSLPRLHLRFCVLLAGVTHRLCYTAENIFDTFSLPQVPFIDRRENLARINGTASLKKPPVECGRCNVPVDSPKVLKSTSRRFRHFKQLLRNIFEVEKKKDSLR